MSLYYPEQDRYYEMSCFRTKKGNCTALLLAFCWLCMTLNFDWSALAPAQCSSVSKFLGMAQCTLEMVTQHFWCVALIIPEGKAPTGLKHLKSAM